MKWVFSFAEPLPDGEGDAKHILGGKGASLAEMTRAIIVMSRLCLIPLGASAAEIWSTADLMSALVPTATRPGCRNASDTPGCACDASATTRRAPC